MADKDEKEIEENPGIETPEVEQDQTEAEDPVFGELDFDEQTYDTEPPDEEAAVESGNPSAEETSEHGTTEANSQSEGGLTADQIQTLATMGFDETDISSLKQSPLLEKIIEYGSDKPNNNTNTTEIGDEIPGSPDENTDDGFNVTLDEDLYDPDLIQQFKSMKSHYDKRIEELNTVIYSLGDAANASRIEKLFADSGLDKFFGTGATTELPQESTEANNRRLVQEEIVALSTGYEATGKETPSFEELFQRASRSVLGDGMDQNARREFVNKVESRHKQRIARPSNRASKSKGSVQQAVTSVSQIMRDRGMMDDNSDSFE